MACLPSNTTPRAGLAEADHEVCLNWHWAQALAGRQVPPVLPRPSRQGPPVLDPLHSVALPQSLQTSAFSGCMRDIAGNLISHHGLLFMTWIWNEVHTLLHLWHKSLGERLACIYISGWHDEKLP